MERRKRVDTKHSKFKVTALSEVSPSHIKLKTQVSHKFKDKIDTLLSNDSEIKLFLLNLLKVR